MTEHREPQKSKNTSCEYNNDLFDSVCKILLNAANCNRSENNEETTGIRDKDYVNFSLIFAIKKGTCII